MLRHLDSYAGAGYGAEQDFLTDFWKTRTGIAGLPRRYNCQLHQVALLGPEAREDSLYWRMVINHREEVANWHFSADPKPVDMIWGSIAFPALETGSGLRRRGLGVPITSDVLRSATTTVQPQPAVHGRVVLTPRQSVQGKGKGRRQNLIERGPVRTEHAAPWRHDLTVAALQVEMSNRSAKWRDGDPTEERRQEINQVLLEATSMWIPSLQHTVWPNIVLMISEEIRLRSRRGREEACLICHQKYEWAGKNIEHNLFHCSMAHHVTDQIDKDTWQAMVKHPFRLQSGGPRIDQQLCYCGTLLQVWEDAADIGMVKPWSLVHMLYLLWCQYTCFTCSGASCAACMSVLLRALLTYIMCPGQTKSSASPPQRAIGTPGRSTTSCRRTTTTSVGMRSAAASIGGSTTSRRRGSSATRESWSWATVPFGRRENKGAIEPFVRRGSHWAIEPVQKQSGHRVGSAD